MFYCNIYVTSLSHFKQLVFVCGFDDIMDQTKDI